MVDENNTHDETSEFEDDFTFEDTKLEGETKSTTEKETEKREEPTEEPPQKEVELETAAKKFIADEIMLDIIVEVGRLQMSIQKLTELQPGNVLEIAERPENGVDLVVNGKRIGKGELLKLGDVIGVRVLDV